MFTWKYKLIALGLALLLPTLSYQFGKWQGNSNCKTDVKIERLQSDIKEKGRQSEIDKDVDRMDSTDVDRAYGHWVR